jgi:hypothetical protein
MEKSISKRIFCLHSALRSSRFAQVLSLIVDRLGLAQASEAYIAFCRAEKAL